MISLSVALLALASVGFEWEGRVGRLRRALESPDVAERVDALRSLARQPTGEVRGALLAALSDGDATVRLEAARAVGEARIAEAVPTLAEWLAEPDPEVRATAARALGAIGDAGALPSLVRALGDARADVRRAAVEGLAQLGGDAAIVPLLARLDDADGDVRVAAVRALVALGDARAVVPLIARARDQAPEVRAAVATALGDLGDARALPPLVQALEDDSIDVQLAAMAALARVGDEDAAQALAIRAASGQDRAASAATAALGRIPSARALAALLEALSHTALAPAAAEALRQRAARDGEAVTLAMAEALDAAETRSRVDALARTLTMLADETPIAPASAALARALDESRGDPSIVLAALGASGAEVALVPLLERLRAPDAVVRRAAQDALARWVDLAGPDGRAADPLLEALMRAEPEERAPLARLLGRVGAPRALPSLRAALDDEDERTRVAAAEAIGAIGDPDGAAALLPLLGARDARLRHAAARALGDVAPASVLADLTQRARDRAPADRPALLYAIGAAAARLTAEGALPAPLRAAIREMLLELATSPDRALASSALAAIARGGDPEAARGLAELSRAAAPAHRAPIAAALAALDDERAREETLAIARGDDDASLVALSRLGEHGDRAAAEWLLADAPAMRWPRGPAASFAIARLARRGVLVPSDQAAICALAASRDPWLRANVAITLAAMGAGACGDDGPDPLAWIEPQSASIVRAAAARWAHAAAERGAIDAGAARAAIERCAREPIPSPARAACRDPALPPGGDRADVIAWSAGGREVLPRTLLALRLPDGSVLLTRSDDAGRIQLEDVARGALALARPATLPLEP